MHSVLFGIKCVYDVNLAKVKSKLNLHLYCTFAHVSLISVGSFVFNYNHRSPPTSQQAGRDTGGKQLQWQAMEGLGAIAFTDGNYEKATRYFKQALALAGESAAASNKFVSDFLKRHLFSDCAIFFKPFLCMYMCVLCLSKLYG